ncbi:MAG: hypothetical protein ACFFDB_00590 [Promethearchaeota archaeon]
MLGAIFKLKNGKINKHNVDHPNQIKIINLSFGTVIRVAPIDSDRVFYYDFNILEKIESVKNA